MDEYYSGGRDTGSTRPGADDESSRGGPRPGTGCRIGSMATNLAPGFLVAVPAAPGPEFPAVGRAAARADRRRRAGGRGQPREPALAARAVPRPRDPLRRRSRQARPAGAARSSRSRASCCTAPSTTIRRDARSSTASTSAPRRDTLSRLCKLPRGRFHCFAGYAGWGPGQLEREIADGSWIVDRRRARRSCSISPPDEAWALACATPGIDPAAIVPGGADAESRSSSL